MYAEHTRLLHGFDPSIEPDQLLQDDWFGRPDELFPYALLEGAIPVGFCLVLGPRYAAAAGEDADFVVWEMWLDPTQRGTGLAEAALRAILPRHPGRWRVCAMLQNGRAMAFWRRVTRGAAVAGEEGRTEDGLATFTFLVS